MVGVPKRCGGFMAIWLRAREEFADNRFQLLFIYILAEAARLRQASTSLRFVNDIPTSCVWCCIVAVLLKTEVRILSP